MLIQEDASAATPVPCRAGSCMLLAEVPCGMAEPSPGISTASGFGLPLMCTASILLLQGLCTTSCIGIYALHWTDPMPSFKCRHSCLGSSCPERRACRLAGEGVRMHLI